MVSGGGSTSGCMCRAMGKIIFSNMRKGSSEVPHLRVVQRPTLTCTNMNSVDLVICKNNDPNKMVYFRIRKTSDDSILREVSFNINTVADGEVKTFTFAALSLSSEEVDIGIETADTVGLHFGVNDFGLGFMPGDLPGTCMKKREDTGEWWTPGGDACYEWFYEEAGIKKLKAPFTKLMKPKVKFRI